MFKIDDIVYDEINDKIGVVTINNLWLKGTMVEFDWNDAILYCQIRREECIVKIGRL